MTEQDRVREAVEIMQNDYRVQFFSYPEKINMDEVQRNISAIQTLLSLANRYLSGELVDVAKVLGDGKLENILKAFACEVDGLADEVYAEYRDAKNSAISAIRSLFGVKGGI